MEIFINALTDTVKLVPLLALVYFLVGFFEYEYGDRMGGSIMRFGALAPVAGAVFGCIPQCGFSVVASALYVKRLISPGTLLAVYISTSDEAVPVLLAMPNKIEMVGNLIVIKLIIAVIAGILIDLVLRSKKVEECDCGSSAHAAPDAHGEDHPGCCAHKFDEKDSKLKMLVIHPLKHTLKIFLYLFAFTLVLNALIVFIGEKRLVSIFLAGNIFQPALASLVGLIPSCLASVFLADLFAKGVITFGSLVAGLSAGAGLGFLVLIRENKNFKDTLFIIGLLLTVSIFSGVVIQFLNR